MEGSRLSNRAERLEELKRGWLPLTTAFLGVATCFAIINGNSFGAFIRPLTQDFGWSRAEISVAATITGAITAVVSPIVGWLADRFGPRRVIAFSVVGAACGFLAQSFNDGQLGVFLVVQGLMATIGAGASAVTYVMLITLWFDKARGLAIGLVMAGTGVTAILAPWLLLPLVEYEGWRAGYRAVAIVLLLTLPLILVGARTPENNAKGRSLGTHRRVQGLTQAEAFRSRQFWLQGIAFLIMGGCAAGYFSHLIPMIQDRSSDLATTAAIASSFGMALVVGRLGCGYLLDHFFAPYLAMFFIASAAAGMICFLSTDLAMMILGAVLVGLAFGSEIDIAGYMTSRYFGTRAYGAIYGWQYGLYMAGAILSPVIFGWVFDRFGSYQLALIGTAVIVCLSAPLFLFMKRYPNWETTPIKSEQEPMVSPA